MPSEPERVEGRPVLLATHDRAAIDALGWPVLELQKLAQFRPGERTLYTADRKDPWEYMWVAFDGFDVLEILRRTGLVNRYVVAVENGEEFARYLREMIEEFSGGSLFKVMSCFYGAMSVLEKSAHGGAYTREHEYVNKAIGYIKSNYGYPIQVSDLARYIGIDRKEMVNEDEQEDTE